jgi:hypothetical protein
MLLFWNPFALGRRGAVKDSQESPAANMGRAKSPPATRNRRLANRLSGRDVAVVSTAVRGSRRDVKQGDTPRYRTSAAASERWRQTIRSNQVAGKKNPHPHSGRDSPRRLHPDPIRPVGGLEHAPGSDKPALAGGIYLARCPDNDGWLSVVASAGQPHGTPNRNSGPADTAVGRSARNPSRDICDDANDAGRLAPTAILRNAEMGPRGVATP